MSNWYTGAPVLTPITNYSTFNTTFATFRHASWGIRITATSSLTNTSGVLYCGYYPAEYTSSGGDVTSPPVNPDQILALPWSFTVPLVELNEEPIVAVARRLDISTTRYRSLDYPNASPSGIEVSDGWGHWFIVVTGGSGVNTFLTIEYVSRNELIPLGSATMFGAGMPAPSNMPMLEAATNIQQVMPTYMLDRPEPGGVFRQVASLLRLASQKYDLPSIAIGMAKNALMGSSPGSYLTMYKKARGRLN